MHSPRSHLSAKSSSRFLLLSRIHSMSFISFVTSLQSTYFFNTSIASLTPSLLSGAMSDFPSICPLIQLSSLLLSSTFTSIMLTHGVYCALRLIILALRSFGMLLRAFFTTCARATAFLPQDNHSPAYVSAVVIDDSMSIFQLLPPSCCSFSLSLRYCSAIRSTRFALSIIYSTVRNLLSLFHAASSRYVPKPLAAL